VFDAFVSPVPVFTEPMPLKRFALDVLGLERTAKITDYETNKSGHSFQLYGSGTPSRYIKHTYYEADEFEVQLSGLTKGQAKVFVENFLRANNWPTDLAEKAPWPGVVEFVHQIPTSSDGHLHAFVFSNGLLALKLRGWFPDSED
jgi:hypothetical protein